MLDSWDLLFNAVTFHPEKNDLLYSSRKEVTDRLYPLLAREIRRQRRINWRRQLLWKVRKKTFPK